MFTAISSPAAVAASRTVDLSGANDALARFDQLAMQRARERAMQQQRDEERQYRNFQIGEKMLDPLTTATGTPLDQYAGERIAKIRETYTDFLAKNPGASSTGAAQVLQREIGTLGTQLQQAKAIRGNIDAAIKLASRDNPLLDETSAQALAYNRAFRNPDGTIREALDVHEGVVEGILNDPAARESIINWNAAQSAAFKELENNFDLRTDKVPVLDANGQPTLVDQEYGVRAYQQYDPANRSVFTRFDKVTPKTEPSKVLGPMNAQIDANRPWLPGAPAEVVESMKRNPAVALLIERELRRMEKADNKTFSSLSDDEKERVAAYRIADEMGSTKGTGHLKDDYSRFDRTRQLKRDAISDSQWAQSHALSVARFNRAGAGGGDDDSGDGGSRGSGKSTWNTTYATIHKAMAGDPAAQAVMPGTTIKIVTGPKSGSIGAAGANTVAPRSVWNLSKLLKGDDAFKERGTGKRREVFFDPQRKEFIYRTHAEAPIPGEAAYSDEIIPKTKVPDELIDLATQMGLNTKQFSAIQAQYPIVNMPPPAADTRNIFQDALGNTAR